MAKFNVKFKFGNSHRQSIVDVKTGSESEVITVMKQRGIIPKDATVVIESIKPA